MSTPVSTTGLPRTALSALEAVPDGSPRKMTESGEAAGPYLAQIPALDHKAVPKSRAKRFDKRLISQALSMKLVFGLGLGLIIGAVVPHLFGRGSTPKPVRELPPWNVRAPEQTAPTTAQSVAPAWQPAAPVATVVAPQTPPAGVTVPPPQPQGYQPATLSQHTWTPPQMQTPPPAATPPVAPANPELARNNLPTGAANDRRYAPPADHRNWQADARNDAVFDYRGNRVETTAPRRDAPPPADYRYNTATPPAGVRSGSPLMPSGANAEVDRYQREAESGIAHFEGTITAPPARTN